MNIRDRIEIECCEGWDKIIEPLVEYVDKYNSTVEKEEDKIKILQIKEKFGGLRFYASNKTEELINLIEDAENKSFKTCEFCGSTDDVGQTCDGWITTCCRKCIEDQAITQQRTRTWYSYKNKKKEEISYEKCCQ